MELVNLVYLDVVEKFSFLCACRDDKKHAGMANLRCVIIKKLNVCICKVIRKNCQGH